VRNLNFTSISDQKISWIGVVVDAVCFVNANCVGIHRMQRDKTLPSKPRNANLSSNMTAADERTVRGITPEDQPIHKVALTTHV
jgi:hypothetical protein